MDNDFKCINRKRKKEKEVNIDFLNKKEAEKALEFHKSFDIYNETPLVNLENLAKKFNLKGLYVKDESYRFNLNAFKVLGGSYAIGNYIAKLLNKDISELPYTTLISDEVRNRVGNLTFITATDGNHGRGVAWTANKLKQNSIVYMPKGSSIERLNNIVAEGANASITELNYDDAVRLANKEAEEKGYVMVQDTAWEGYEDIPKWIMQGYSTMAYEAYNQLKGIKPTHIFLQAGVGSFAGSVQGFFANMYGEDRPITTIVEPNAANCIYKSAEAGDGQPRFVTGDMNTIMAGLACGEPNTISWKVIDEYTDNFVSCPDYVAETGMRVLGNPLDSDQRVVSGESGASTFGLICEIMNNNKLAWLKDKLQLNEESIVLCFSTEGDTDKENYRKIVWNL